MKRAAIVVGVLVFIGVVAIVLQLLQRGQTTSSQTLAPLTNSPIADAVAFARNHFTGGIGAILSPDPTTGYVKIQDLLSNSPAQNAGLQRGDIVTGVNGISTKGRMLAQVVNDLRGIARGRVTLSVQRAGITNLDFTLNRESWGGLGVPISSIPAILPFANPALVPGTNVPAP